jgi:hypothetical protein
MNSERNNFCVLSTIGRGYHVTTLCEYSANELFEDDNVNWRYCVDHANFVHNDEECEFILHLYTDNGDDWFAEEILHKMQEFGCTEEFIALVRDARCAGFDKLLLWA